MSALLTRRRPPRPRRDRAREAAEQPSLFGTPPAPAAAAPMAGSAPAAASPAATATAPAAEAPGDSTTASARRQGPTLDDLVAGAWEGLLAGAPAACVVCGAAVSPRYSAGAGVVGGRCGGCGSALS